MAADTLNRAGVRQALATVLATKLTGVGGSAEEVFDHQVGDFGTKNPVVVVTVAGSEPELFDTMGDDAAFQQVDLNVFVFVLYTATDDAGNVVWTEEESEDRLDLIHKQIIDALLDNPSLGGVVDEVKPNGRSTIVPYAPGGIPYRVELIPLRAQKAHA